MSASLDKYIPWRERAFVSVAETAAIFGRSTSWVRDRLTDGSLDRAQIAAGGSIGITVTSVVALIDGARPVPEDAPVRSPRTSRRGNLYLVADNDV